MYVFDKPDHLLTEEERRKKNAVLKRRARQNRSYYRRKLNKKEKVTGSEAGERLNDIVPGDLHFDEDGAKNDELHLVVKENVFEDERIVRSAGLKNIVMDNVRERFSRLPLAAQEAMQNLAVFPQDFDLAAGVSVMSCFNEQTPQGLDMLQTLARHQLICVMGDRFELNNIAKIFLQEDNMRETMGQAMERSTQRYVMHYKNVMEELNTADINRFGVKREELILSFDKERTNIECSINLCRKLGSDVLRDFLSTAATPMRFCVDAVTRVRHFLDALEDAPKTAELRSENDRRNIARLQVAVAEAKCDMLVLEEAESPLRTALTSMEWCRSESPAAILDTVLVLLLTAAVRINSNQSEDGHAILIRVLRILRKTGQRKTTHAINALTNLVTIYVQKGELEKANIVAKDLLDTLHAMNYDDMPIYADALGVYAMVNLNLGHYSEAVKQFGSALEVRAFFHPLCAINQNFASFPLRFHSSLYSLHQPVLPLDTTLQVVANWGSRTWRLVPMEHCLDLDIWLMQGLAIAFHKQVNTVHPHPSHVYTPLSILAQRYASLLHTRKKTPTSLSLC